MAPSRRRLLFAVLAGASTTLIACAGIIGLDDFHKGECPGAVCEGGTNPDVNQPDSPFGIEGGPDGGEAGPGTPPVSWADWPMPNYDAGTADVENVPTYDTSTAPQIKDTITGLIWLEIAAIPSSEPAAESYCAGQTMGGKGWRLPTRIELVTLLDFGSKSGTLVATPFSTTASTAHWTSSPERDQFGGTVASAGARSYWTVDFATGAVNLQPEGRNLAVKCVKGGI